MYQIFIALISLYVLVFLDCAESKLCGTSNCTEKCCLGSNVYPLCRKSCDGVICAYDKNCDGGYCCVRQCVANSSACNEVLHVSPTQSQRLDGGEKTVDLATWEFALIILGSVVAGVLLCILFVWGCRMIISSI